MSEADPSFLLQIAELLAKYQVVQFAVALVIMYGGYMFIKRGQQDADHHPHEDMKALEAEWILKNQMERIDRNLDDAVDLLRQIRDILWNKSNLLG